MRLTLEGARDGNPRIQEAQVEGSHVHGQAPKQEQGAENVHSAGGVLI